jgi:hypothetical protein
MTRIYYPHPSIAYGTNKITRLTDSTIGTDYHTAVHILLTYVTTLYIQQDGF